MTPACKHSEAGFRGCPDAGEDCTMFYCPREVGEYGLRITFRRVKEKQQGVEEE